MSYFAPWALLQLIVFGSPGRFLNPLPSSFLSSVNCEAILESLNFGGEMSVSVHSAAQNSRYFWSSPKCSILILSDQLSLLRSLVSENPRSVNAVDAVGV
jgi:hypothetical protein